jgi:hypothetical protein
MTGVVSRLIRVLLWAMLDVFLGNVGQGCGGRRGMSDILLEVVR